MRRARVKVHVSVGIPHAIASRARRCARLRIGAGVQTKVNLRVGAWARGNQLDATRGVPQDKEMGRASGRTRERASEGTISRTIARARDMGCTSEHTERLWGHEGTCETTMGRLTDCAHGEAAALRHARGARVRGAASARETARAGGGEHDWGCGESVR